MFSPPLSSLLETCLHVLGQVVADKGQGLSKTTGSLIFCNHNLGEVCLATRNSIGVPFVHIMTMFPCFLGKYSY